MTTNTTKYPAPHEYQFQNIYTPTVKTYIKINYKQVFQRTITDTMYKKNERTWLQ